MTTAIQPTTLLPGDDPHGFKLRDHPSNSSQMRAAIRHEQRECHHTSELYADTPQGDVAIGMCCYACDWQTYFRYTGRRKPKNTVRTRK